MALLHRHCQRLFYPLFFWVSSLPMSVTTRLDRCFHCHFFPEPTYFGNIEKYSSFVFWHTCHNWPITISSPNTARGLLGKFSSCSVRHASSPNVRVSTTAPLRGPFTSGAGKIGHGAGESSRVGGPDGWYGQRGGFR